MHTDKNIGIIIIVIVLLLFSCNDTVDIPVLIESVSTGRHHTIAIGTDGSLWAWGHNMYGKLGDGSIKNRLSPVRIGLKNEWKIVSAGDNHTVAIGTDGSLWAWGYNHYGQLGDDSRSDRYSPVRIGLENNWQTVSAGGVHTVAIKTDGSLWRWGSISAGTWDTSPVRIGLENNWQIVSAGGSHIAVIKTDGSLWAWGYNTFGQIGDGSTNYVHSPVQIGTDNNWKTVSAGPYHTVAIKTDGSLWAWGANMYGQLGIGDGDGFPYGSNSPVQIGADNNWEKISAGCTHTVALKTDGSLWAWGANNSGQLGDNSTERHYFPVRIGIDCNWSTISSGDGDSSSEREYAHTIAVKTDGSLWTWGYNQFGQLGDGSIDDRHSPVRIEIWKKL